MNLVEEHSNRWREFGRFRGLHASLSLEKNGLVLGAKTVLAKRGRDGSIAVDGEEARLLTLLTIAYGHPVPSSLLGTIHKASKYARAGDECMASMLIALARLPKLRDPGDVARRLFIADALMDDGISPRDIWTALDLDPASLDEFEKFYNPDEPRVPAGSGRPSGEWTGEGGTVDSRVPTGVAARTLSGDAEITESAAERTTSDAGTAAEDAASDGWEVVPEAALRAAGPLGKLVFYDDCQRSTGSMVEYKGRGYAKRLLDPTAKSFQDNITAQWLGQATRQVEASGSQPVQWYFAEMPALEFARHLFGKYKYLERIQLVYAPLPENPR